MATSRADGDDRPLRVIGRYALVSEIAPGALGELWKARIASGPEQGRVVSIRRIPRTNALDSQAVERLTNVGFAAMEVRHPKITAVLDVVVADSEIALVSEHIGGAVLTTVLRPPSGKRPNVAPDVALRIVLDLLEAVDAVHAQWRDLFPAVETEDDRLLRASAHGGLVPDSVLLASFGEAMLLDAGLAGIAMTMHPILDHADVIAYRAPEQLEAGGVADERSDVFTVGVLIWELLAARPLFAPAIMPRPAAAGPAVKTKAFSDAMQVSTVKRKVLTATIQRLDSLPLLRGKVTKPFADLVARCLERDPANRFQSVQELIAAIAELGPRAVAGYDAVSRLLASVGAAAPSEEASMEPGSGRSTSNRPTVPPEKGKGMDSEPPDTRRAPVAAGAKSLDVTPEQPKGETVPDAARREAPVDSVDEALSVADLQSIPPSADTLSIPPSTDVESLPPSTEPRVTPQNAPSSAGVSVDVESLPAASPATGRSPTVPEPAKFASVLVPPLMSAGERTEETTSAPVVRPLGDEGKVDLASTLMSSQSSSKGTRKVIIGVVAAAGVLALVGIVRVATSSSPKEPDALSASAAPSSAPPIATVVETPPAPAPVEPSPAVSAEAPEPAAPPEQPVPAAVPALSPTGVPQPGQLKRLPPLPKKKPYRPSGI